MSEQINYVNKPIMDSNVQITKQKLALKQPKQLETPLTVLGQTETEVEGALGAINDKERVLTYSQYRALTDEERNNGTTYYVSDWNDSGDKEVVEGYYNSTDGKFYEESTYTTEIIGSVGCVYIDIPTDRLFIWNSTDQEFVDTTADYVKTSDIVTTPISGSGSPISSGGTFIALNGKADKATSLSGYGITNAYTKDEVDELFAEHENNISWKPAVSTYADIATTYPNPQEGWTVVTTDTNIAWRYSGGQWVEISANTIPIATTSVDGLMSTNMVTKLNGIASGAEVNQNAFSNIVVGSTTVAADSKTDTLTLVGSNVTLTPDATNDKVTIGITKANVTTALGYTPPTSDTNTHRPIQVNGTQVLGDNTTALNLKAGSNMSVTNSNGTVTFAATNTTTGTTYAAGSCPNNTTFGTNGSIANAFAWLNSNKVSKYAYKNLGDNYVMTASTFDSGMNLYNCGSLKLVTNNGYKNWIPNPINPNVDVGDYYMLSLYGGSNTFMIVLCITPRLPQYIHIGSFWDGKFNGWFRYSGAVIS